jgi:hypothetical protein
MTAQSNELNPKYVKEFTDILQKEGINHSDIIHFAVSDNLHESRLEKKYKHFLGSVLVQGKPFVLSPADPRYDPEINLHHKYLLLVDRIGKRVIGGSPVAPQSTWITFSNRTIRCSDDELDYKSNYPMYILMCVAYPGMENILPANLMYELKEKPDEDFNTYDKFIRKLVYLTDLHIGLQESIGLDRFVSKYVDTYSSYADEVRVTVAKLEQEIDSIFNNYPEEFKDIPVSLT